MSLDLLIYLFFYFIIINSTIGYGYLVAHFTKIDFKFFDSSFLGLLGIFVLLLISYVSHIFVAHDYIHNSIILIIGILSFVYFFLKEKKGGSLIKINLFFLLLFISFIIFKSHDDFSYYHFPYIYYLTQTEIVLGIGNFNHGFRTPSSIFYLNSLFYLPYLDYYLYHMGALLVLGFTNIILISNIKKNLDEKENNQFFFLNLLAFIFINIFFYRLAEHGTDRSAQILIFLFFIYILPLRGCYENFDSILSKLIILLSIIVSLKSFYVLYFIFIIPFFYYIMKDDKGYLVYKIFKNPMLYFSILMGVCVILVYFFNTGCLLYPVQQTCITGMEWSIPKSEVSALNTHYQWWSKAGGGPGYSHELEKSLYIQNFNWLSNWIDKYFFNKMSDLLLGLSLISIIVLLIFRSKKKYLDHKKSNNNILYYYFIILLLVEWFYNHPALRYGGYIIFALIFFIPLSNFLSKYEISKNFKIKTNILFFLVTLIFLGRNIDRIFYEFEFYNANFKHNMFFFTDKYHFRIDDQLKKYSKNYQNCNLNIDKCLENKDFVIKKNYGKLIIIKNRN